MLMLCFSEFKTGMTQLDNKTPIKKLLLALAIACTFGGVLLWWYEDGRYSTSVECKAAREQYAELKVDSSVYAALYRESRRLELFKANQQIERYCKKYPPS